MSSSYGARLGRR